VFSVDVVDGIYWFPKCYFEVVRCSVLQCLLRCVAGCCRVLQCVAVCCSVLQCVAVDVVDVIWDMYQMFPRSKGEGCSSVLQCVAVCCSQRVAVCLRCVAVCCGVLRWVAVGSE